MSAVGEITMAANTAPRRSLMTENEAITAAVGRQRHQRAPRSGSARIVAMLRLTARPWDTLCLGCCYRSQGVEQSGRAVWAVNTDVRDRELRGPRRRLTGR